MDANTPDELGMVWDDQLGMKVPGPGRSQQNLDARRLREATEAERKRERREQPVIEPDRSNPEYIDARLQDTARAAQQGFNALSQAGANSIITDELVVEVISAFEEANFHLRCLLAGR